MWLRKRSNMLNEITVEETEPEDDGQVWGLHSQAQSGTIYYDPGPQCTVRFPIKRSIQELGNTKGIINKTKQNYTQLICVDHVTLYRS